MQENRHVNYRGIDLFVGWENGSGVAVSELPAKAGVYAEIYWPERGVRIGETGRSIRGKIRHDIRWFTSMMDGSAPPEQLRRTLPIAEAAKATGAQGFEFFVVSDNPLLAEKNLRQECERFLFRWLATAQGWVNWNRQVSWR
ncbi:hypothetical protein [Albidovulum sp.]|uniref:hypothetical protein n=1 Tax=Albidovulum sp. TaxID=1872424 RepID=UPI0039B8A6FF